MRAKKSTVHNLVIGTCAGLVILAGCSNTEISRLRFKSSEGSPYTMPGLTAMDAPEIDDSWKANLIEE